METPLPDPVAARPHPAADPQEAPPRQSRRVRMWLQWSALARNVIGATKDLGIIAIFVALLFFSEEVLEYLDERGASFMPAQPPVDVPSAFIRLNRGADSLPVTAEATLGASAPIGGKKGRKVLRAEQRLLRADEADFINDWALVISATTNVDSAKRLAASVHPGPNLQMHVYRKSTTIRLVVPLGRADEARPAISAARGTYPGAALVSLSSWCPSPTIEDGIIACK